MKGQGGVGSTVVEKGMGMIFNAECRYKDAELCKFMNNWKQPSEYTMHSTMTAKNTPKMEFNSAIDGDDNHTTMTENGKVTHETISLAGIEYVKDLSDGKWWKIIDEKTASDPKEEMMEVDFDFTKKMETVEDKTTYVRIGIEACGTLECYKYQVVDPANTRTKEFIWFDNKDYLMQKMRSEEIGGDMAVSEFVTTYGNVTISVPSPIKEGSTLDVYGAASGMSPAEIEALKKQQVEAEKAAAEYLKSME